jgi:SAM-dependent methyltransferase
VRYLDREESLVEAARGRKVLNLGCVGFVDLTPDNSFELAEASLHYRLSRVADVTGIDFTADNVRLYRDLGVFENIVVGNVEKLDEVDLDDTFELVVAGDIIEHLSNPGLMLDGIKRFCAPDSKVIVTTPHAHGLPNYLRFVRGSFSDGSHVLSFNLDNMRNLLDRHGYDVERIDTCFEQGAKERGGILFRAGKAVISRFPRFGGTLFVIARPILST